MAVAILDGRFAGNRGFVDAGGAMRPDHNRNAPASVDAITQKADSSGRSAIGAFARIVIDALQR